MDVFYKALSFVDSTAIKLMGGEPTLHPNIIEIVDACHKVVPAVRFFTNGLKKEILNEIHWSPHDTVTYNFYVANTRLTNQNYLWEENISRTFHVVISTKTDLPRLFTKLRTLAGLLQSKPDIIKGRSGVAVSLDTQENIFAYKDELQKILYTIVRRLRLWGIRHISRDHHIPICFWTNEGIHQYLDTHLRHNSILGCLSPDCASWIGIDGTIRHCNQFPVYCGKLSDCATSASIRALYQKAKEFKVHLLQQDNECRNCPYLETCSGGCFKAYHLDSDISLHRMSCD
jgi:radical SAM protein with 4Fe4S-binding SPASM domain